jgi:hypothetical protein
VVCVPVPVLHLAVCATPCRHGSEPFKTDERMRFIRELWRRRLSGVQRNVEVRGGGDGCVGMFREGGRQGAVGCTMWTRHAALEAVQGLCG